MMASSASQIASASMTATAASNFTSSTATTTISSNSPCAACKFLRRKCQPDCVFAPYFPPDNPQKFAHVHKVFGASNVTKLLNELDTYQREDAVNSLAYEADMRLRDPVYGCVGVISLLQHQLRQLQVDLARAKSELSKYQSATGISAGNGLIHLNQPIGVEFFGLGNGRDTNNNNSTNNTNQMFVRSFDAEMAARVGVCDAGLMATMANNMSSAAPFGFQFSRPKSAGVDERQIIRHS